ncbi:MAG: hypothetical protein ACRDG9_12820, partial [Actinomycetota bacterium]
MLKSLPAWALVPAVAAVGAFGYFTVGAVSENDGCVASRAPGVAVEACPEETADAAAGQVGAV